jgi:hypothetical protein
MVPAVCFIIPYVLFFRSFCYVVQYGGEPMPHHFGKYRLIHTCILYIIVCCSCIIFIDLHHSVALYGLFLSLFQFLFVVVL